MINKVTLLGNLGQNPELKYAQNGNAVLNLRMATNDRYRDAKGEWHDRTEWHTVVVFGKSAESLVKKIKKGTLLYVEGRIHSRSYEDKTGVKRYVTEVSAGSVRPLARMVQADEQSTETDVQDVQDQVEQQSFDDSEVPF